MQINFILKPKAVAIFNKQNIYFPLRELKCLIYSALKDFRFEKNK